MNREWEAESLRELILHILDRHHSFARSELARLKTLVEHLHTTEGDRNDLARIRAIVAELRDELLPHMMREEQILFPFVALMEEASVTGRPVPVPPFVSVENPIRMMFAEHDAAASLLGELRTLTNDFEIAAGGSPAYQAMVDRLRVLDSDLRLHIHLENHHLFPRAVRLEDEAVAGVKYDTCVLR